MTCKTKLRVTELEEDVITISNANISLKEQLDALRKENTECLATIAELRRDNATLSKRLDYKHGALVDCYAKLIEKDHE